MSNYTGFRHIDRKLRKMNKNKKVIIIQSKSINYSKLLGFSIAKNRMIQNVNSCLYYYTNSISLDGYWLVNNQIKDVESYNRINILTNWNLKEKNEMFENVSEDIKEIICLIEINNLQHLRKIESLITKEIDKNRENNRNILFVLCSKKIKLDKNSAIDLVVEINTEYENENPFNYIEFDCNIACYNELNNVDNFKLLFTKDNLYNLIVEDLSNKNIIPIRQINTLKSEEQNVLIIAKVLEIDKKILKDVCAYRYKVADESGVIYVKMVMRLDAKFKKIEIGQRYHIRGKIVNDSYENNLVLFARKIEEI